eukprot:Pgem_evm1s18497
MALRKSILEQCGLTPSDRSWNTFLATEFKPPKKSKAATAATAAAAAAAAATSINGEEMENENSMMNMSTEHEHEHEHEHEQEQVQVQVEDGEERELDQTAVVDGEIVNAPPGSNLTLRWKSPLGVCGCHVFERYVKPGRLKGSLVFVTGVPVVLATPRGLEIDAITSRICAETVTKESKAEGEQILFETFMKHDLQMEELRHENKLLKEGNPGAIGIPSPSSILQNKRKKMALQAAQQAAAAGANSGSLEARIEELQSILQSVSVDKLIIENDFKELMQNVKLAHADAEKAKTMLEKVVHYIPKSEHQNLCRNIIVKVTNIKKLTGPMPLETMEGDAEGDK